MGVEFRFCVSCFYFLVSFESCSFSLKPNSRKSSLDIRPSFIRHSKYDFKDPLQLWATISFLAKQAMYSFIFSLQSPS